MSSPPVQIYNASPEPSPNEYVVPAGLDFIPTSVAATFDGSAAASGFRPCLSFYTQDGRLVARSFPEDELLAGESAEVTFAPF